MTPDNVSFVPSTIPSTVSVIDTVATININTTIDGYTPKNAKVRQYPYLYLGFNPPNGNPKVFRYEEMACNNHNHRLWNSIQIKAIAIISGTGYPRH